MYFLLGSLSRWVRKQFLFGWVLRKNDSGFAGFNFILKKLDKIVGVFWKYTLSFLLLSTILVWLAILAIPGDNLSLIACDVGQGDAILAIYGKTQVLVDGGPDAKVLECLSKYLPFWDKKIEGVLLTHPQKDHLAGLVEVLKRYEVEVFIATPVDSSTMEFEVLKSLVGGKGIRLINPVSPMSIRFGLIYLDIVWPSGSFVFLNTSASGKAVVAQDSNVLGIYSTKRDLNDFSIVAVLKFGDFDALLTGDISQKIADEILATGLIKDVEYIKVPHHGSKNGLTQEFLDASTPEIAIISSGRNNPYGHPHQEVLKMLSEKGVKILRTDQEGDIKVSSDGKDWRVEAGGLRGR